MGSMVALEWAATYPDYVTELVLIAGCGRHTDWAIGIGEAQRFSIMADAKFKGGSYDAADPPRAGLATSRMMAMLSYRAPASVDDRFSRGVQGDNGVTIRKPSSHSDLGVLSHGNADASEALPFFAVESYLQYQGKKVHPAVRRQLLHPADAHPGLARRRTRPRDVRGGVEEAQAPDPRGGDHLGRAVSVPPADGARGDDAARGDVRHRLPARPRRVPHRDQGAQPRDREVPPGRTRGPQRRARRGGRREPEANRERERPLAAVAGGPRRCRRAPRRGARARGGGGQDRREGGEEARRADALLAEVARSGTRSRRRRRRRAAAGRAAAAGGGAAAAATTGRGRRCLGTGFAFSRRTRRRTGGSSPCTGRSSRPLRARTRPWPRLGRFEGGGGRGRKGGGGERKRRSASRVMARTSQPTNPNLMSASVCRAAADDLGTAFRQPDAPPGRRV